MHANRKFAAMIEFGLLLLLGALWGIPYALTKIALQTIPPITLTAARVSLAAAALWIVAMLLGRRFPRQWDFAWYLFIQSCAACIIPYTLIAFGQQSVDSTLAVILNSSTPLFVCLISALWTHHEQITFGRLLGMIVGLGGVVTIAGASALQGLGGEVVGQAAILIATFSSAVSVIYGRRFADISSEVAAAGTLTCAAIVLVPLCLVLERPWHIALSVASATALGANALIATAFGFVIYFRLIRTIGSMGTSSASLIKPGIGVLIGCTLMGEPATWTLGFGLLAVLFGVAAINERASIQFLSNAIKHVRDHSRRNNRPIMMGGTGT